MAKQQSSKISVNSYPITARTSSTWSSMIGSYNWLLLQSGADPRLADSFGKRPADRAKDPAIIRMLRDASEYVGECAVAQLKSSTARKTPNRVTTEEGSESSAGKAKRNLSAGVTAYHSQRLLFLQELQELEPRKQLYKKIKNKTLILTFNQFDLIAQPMLIQQNISNLMGQSASTSVQGQQNFQDNKDAEMTLINAEKKLIEEFERAKQFLAKIDVILDQRLIDDEDRKQLSQSMKPFKNFVENKTKAAILCAGSISSGKSSLLNALIGNCILPSGNLETTETITKLIPSQELNSNTCFLIKDNGTTKKQLDLMDVFRYNDQENLNAKKNTQNPLPLEIENNFLFLNKLQKNPLIERHQLEFVDLPGCDSQKEGKDQRILDFSSTLGDFPKLILFIISPQNIPTESTKQFLKTAKRVLTDEINNHKRVQNQFYTILQGIKEKEIKNDDKEKEIINDNYNENSESTEKLVQQQLCIVINKYDILNDAEAKKIQDELTTTYQIQPYFVSSKKQIEYTTLKHRTNTLNIRILLDDQEIRRQALNFFPKDRKANLSQNGPSYCSSWTEGEIKRVQDNAPNLFKQYFNEDENIEERTRIQQFVLQLMIKITNECQQYLWNNSRKIQHLSEALKIRLSQKIIDEQINPKDFKSFQSARDQCYKDLEEQILTLQQKQLKQLKTSIKKVEIFFTDIEKLVTQIQKGQFEQIEEPLEAIRNEFHENMEKLTQGSIEATIASMRSRMPFLKGEIYTKISLLLKVQILARQQLCELNLQDELKLKQYGQSGIGITTTTLTSSVIGGLTGLGIRAAVTEAVAVSVGGTAAATFAFLSVGTLGVGAAALVISSGYKWNKSRKAKEEIRNLLKSDQANLIRLLRSNHEENSNLNIYCLRKSMEKVFQALDKAYAQKRYC